MTSVVSSSSINSAFISTTDHLPCDIIRSIWLVQSLNISMQKAKNSLHHLLLGDQDNDSTASAQGDVAQKVVHLKDQIERLHQEAISESQALQNQLATHRLGLVEEIDQLEQIIEYKRNSRDHSNENSSQQDELRKQLEEHYEKNPLVSQREAVEEQGILRSQKSQKIKLAGTKHRKPRNSGLKLVFKVPAAKMVSNGKISKVKTKEKAPRKVKQPLPVKEEVEVEPEDTNTYCFCKQGSFGDMIACDNEDSCPNGEWFHYKCVGLLNRVDALKFTTGKQKWFCSDHCREVVESALQKKKKKKRGRPRR